MEKHINMIQTLNSIQGGQTYQGGKKWCTYEGGKTDHV